MSSGARAAAASIGALAIAFATHSLAAQAGGGGGTSGQGGQGGAGVDSAIVSAVVPKPTRPSIGDMLYFPLLFRHPSAVVRPV